MGLPAGQQLELLRVQMEINSPYALNPAAVAYHHCAGMHCAALP